MIVKLAKLILIPLTANEIKEVNPNHWLLMNGKRLNERGEIELHVPAAGGEYRRLIASGNYTAVKPYLICNDEINKGDFVEDSGTIIQVNNADALRIYKERHSDGVPTIKWNKVIATPDQIFGSQIIMFNEGVKENFDHRAMGMILRMNGGGCKLVAEYAGSITTNVDEVLTEIKAGKVKPVFENGKVIITI